MQEYYDLLGISEDATNEEVENAYKELKNKYTRDRFLEGEAGNIAARNLTRVEVAYQEIMSERNEKKTETESASLAEVDELIRANDLNGAQSKLDSITLRDAEWHYLQSVVYYKKNWLNESKKQLEIAMNMEPNNTKYSDAYTKLKAKTEFNESRFYSGNAQGQSNGNQGMNRSYSNNQMGGDGIGDCLSCCTTWCCMDMMCSMCCR